MTKSYEQKYYKLLIQLNKNAKLEHQGLTISRIGLDLLGSCEEDERKDESDDETDDETLYVNQLRLTSGMKKEKLHELVNDFFHSDYIISWVPGDGFCALWAFYLSYLSLPNKNYIYDKIKNMPIKTIDELKDILIKYCESFGPEHTNKHDLKRELLNPATETINSNILFEILANIINEPINIISNNDNISSNISRYYKLSIQSFYPDSYTVEQKHEYKRSKKPKIITYTNLIHYYPFIYVDYSKIDGDISKINRHDSLPPQAKEFRKYMHDKFNAEIGVEYDFSLITIPELCDDKSIFRYTIG